jgi:large subunit ribosomal protein L1
MSKRGKAYIKAKEKILPRAYPFSEAAALLKEVKTSKFDESVDVSVRLAVDPKYPEQMVRGTVVLPFGTGKVKRVLVIAAGEKQKEASEAGADHVGGEEIVEKIQKENWFEYDVVIATPDMMKSVGRLGKALGTKGLMPSPKAGTVTFNVRDTVAEIKKGRVEFRVDKAGIIHSTIAKTSFAADQIAENAKALLGAILKARPATLKGRYVKSVFISSTMSPAIKLDIAELES